MTSFSVSTTLILMSKIQPAVVVMGLEEEVSLRTSDLREESFPPAVYELVLGGPPRYEGDGSRRYHDTGCCSQIPEFASPECREVGQLFAWLQRLRTRELIPALQTLGSEYYVDLVSKKQGDGAGCSVGSHENYLSQIAPHELAVKLAPHLATRHIICGAGFLDPSQLSVHHSPTLLFSPRVTDITGLFGGEVTVQKKMVKVNGMNYCGGGGQYGYRFQVVGGDFSMTEGSMLLRFGPMSQLIRLAECDSLPKKLDCYDAEHFLADLHGSNPLTIPGRLSSFRMNGFKEVYYTPLDVQYAYLEACENRKSDLFNSIEDRRILSLWRRALDVTTNGSWHLLNGESDFATMYCLLDNHREGRARSPGGSQLEELRPLFGASRLGTEEYDHVFGESSVCNRLDDTDKQRIENAKNPPSDTRAKGRALLARNKDVLRNLFRRQRFALSWDGVYLQGIVGNQCVLAMPDPRKTYEDEVRAFLGL